MANARPHEFKLVAERKGDTEISLQRKFRGPKNLVFECFTNPELLSQWLGCDIGKTIRCTMDTSIGGNWEHLMKMQNDQIFHTFGQILEFQLSNRLVRTYIFNVPKIREAVSTETAEFSESNGVTTVNISIKHLSKENRDGHFASGLEGGAGMSFDGLDRLLEKKLA